MRKVSITTKITIWYTAFMVFITVGVLSVLVYTGNLRASEAVKTLLMDSVADASEEIEGFGGNFIVDDNLNFYEDGVYISIYDDEGELVEGRRPRELSQLPELKDKETVKLADNNDDAWYVYDSLFKVDDRFVWVRGIVKDPSDKSTFSFVQNLAIITLPLLVIIAALGGYVITRRAFRPVREVINTVEEISEDGDLSRRINVHKNNDDSGDEIYRLAGTFNGMFDKLEKSFKQEKQFTADVSHELRTPLAVMISQSEYAIEDPEYREKALEVMNREARRMSGLVNKLLTLSRSDAGRLTPDKENLQLSEICEMVAQQQTESAAFKGISIETDIAENICILADESMIIRILLNLMDNAVKYGRENGKVRLSLVEDNGFAVCAVEDDGIGIAEGELDRIWERFYRADVSRSEEGSGLGLSMVAALVKAHGGRAEVTSTEGQGSCFKVYLPLYDADAEEI